MEPRGTINVIKVSVDVMDDINLNGNTCRRATLHPAERGAITITRQTCSMFTLVIHQHFILSLILIKDKDIGPGFSSFFLFWKHANHSNKLILLTLLSKTWHHDSVNAHFLAQTFLNSAPEHHSNINHNEAVNQKAPVVIKCLCLLSAPVKHLPGAIHLLL